MTTTEILRDMYLRVQKGWCPQLHDGEARCFMGAFYEVLCKHEAPIDDWMKERHKLLVLLRFEREDTKADKVSGAQLVAWNDAPERTQADVLIRILEAMNASQAHA